MLVVKHILEIIVQPRRADLSGQKVGELALKILEKQKNKLFLTFWAYHSFRMAMTPGKQSSP